EQLKKILNEQWIQHHYAVSIYISDDFAYKTSWSCDWIDELFDRMHQVHHIRRGVMLFLWKGYKQRWESCSIQQELETGMKRPDILPRVCNVWGLRKESKSLNFNWMKNEIEGLLKEQQEKHMRLKTNKYMWILALVAWAMLLFWKCYKAVRYF